MNSKNEEGRMKTEDEDGGEDVLNPQSSVFSSDFKMRPAARRTEPLPRSEQSRAEAGRVLDGYRELEHRTDEERQAAFRSWRRARADFKREG